MLGDQREAQILSVVQEKFNDSQIVRNILLNVQPVREDLLADHRLLALVDNQQSYGLFVLISEHLVPQEFTDLTIERAIPIDDNFFCDTDSIPSEQSHIIYNLKYKTQLLSYKVEIGFASAEFATEVIKAKEYFSLNPLDHSWLGYYSSSKLSGNFNMEDEMSSDISVSRQKMTQGGGISTNRESLLKYELDQKKPEYTHQERFSIFVGTWNVNGKPPPTDPKILREWLENEPDPPDVYAIGFQELDLSKEAFIFNETVREAEWQRALDMSTHSGAKYRLVGLVRLVGIQLAVMINYRHFEYVTNVCIDTAGTGILGKMGNKGGVAVSFQLHDTNLCFVNCHLAAHAEEVERRNQDYMEISNRISFRRNNSAINLNIKDHDQIYWMGDFNYRLKDINAIKVKQLIQHGDLQSLLARDQLHEQKLNSRILHGYNEGDITFHPTYKYDVGTDCYDSSEKARVPSWTDRIFSKGKGIHQLSYMCHMGLKISDHKPVYAKFSSEISIINKDKYRKVHEDVLKGLDKLENEYLPQVTIDTTEVHFEKVKFHEPQSEYITIANTGVVPVQFIFIGKHGNLPHCKSWLRILPSSGNIIPGEKCDIQLEVQLDDCATRLDDILILHLENGKDLFISVSADCIRTSFMMSISALCKCPVPILQLTPEQLKNATLDQSSVLYQIPRELWNLVDYLYRNGLKTRELFEGSALREEIYNVRDWLDNGSLDPMPGSVHAVADCLLLFLSFTKDPIVPYHLQNKCADVSEYFISCKEVIEMFPTLHRNTFLYICMFLQELIKYRADNGVERHGLAVMFADILMRAPDKSTPPQVCRKKIKFIEQFLSNDLTPLVSTK